ncbi:kelch repeat-containing protein [Archangium lipolyticum]|uniref:kelch repeat-containing protein n=1 Tax=Archangium lipolyticum TaxID=2970465 RepID=UPI0038993D33
MRAHRPEFRSCALVTTPEPAPWVDSGAAQGITDWCEPSPNQWSSTGALWTARLGHTMTLLKNGKVLVTGGTGQDGTVLSSAERYDPDTPPAHPPLDPPLRQKLRNSNLGAS